MVTLQLEVAFDTPPGQEPSAWTDLTDRLVGTAQISDRPTVTLDDPDRDLDPTNPGSPYLLLPMRHLRLTAVTDVGMFPLFRGFVEKWPPVWATYGQAQVQVEAVEPLVWLAMDEQDVDLPRQRTDERVGALLDLAGWPASRRDMHPGVVVADAHEQKGVNLRRLLEDTAEIEDGDLYVDPDGSICFRSRHSRFDQSPVLTLDTYHGEVPVPAMSPQFSAGATVNIARWEASDGASGQVVDTESVDQLGPRADTSRDLPMPAYEQDALAKWDVYRWAWPQTRLDSVTVPMGTDSEVAAVMGLSRGDLIEVVHRPPGGGTATFKAVFEQRQITIGKTWQATLGLSPYFGEGPWFRFDDPDFGWDSDARWAP